MSLHIHLFGNAQYSFRGGLRYDRRKLFELFQEIYSIKNFTDDNLLVNATQFRAANRTLSQLLNNLIVDPQVCSYYATKGITWKFITKYAPWQGGYYERLIGIVKGTLRKTIGRKVLKFEDFRTLLCDVTAVINSRPLTYVCDELTLTVIRPVDFLQCGGPTGIAPVEAFKNPDYVPPQEQKELYNLYKANLALTDIYWEYLKDEYLLSLRERQTTLHENTKRLKQQIPKVGDVVLVKEIYPRRGEWEYGQTRSYTHTENNYVKRVTVILPKWKHIERPLSSPYPIECAYVTVFSNFF